MIDNKPETAEQPKPERVIKLGEEFQLFDPQRVHVAKWGNQPSRYDYRLLLDIEDNFQLPLHVYTADIDDGDYTSMGRERYLMPFGPRDDGYPIDPEDFNIKTRRSKLKRMQKELQQPIDLTKNPLWLFLDTDVDELHELGLNKEKGDNYEFPYKMIDLLKRLRLTLKTPEGLFEATPSSDYPRTGTVFFGSFYPADFGPLATDDPVKLSYGLELALPSDLEKLSQIRARFVMVDEQPDETA